MKTHMNNISKDIDLGEMSQHCDFKTRIIESTIENILRCR